ncbi:uncharacterized protein LOC143283422 [Babylonia areolata]|uniref:uncharacterized protein LOC143283422 n=1 Tax=Babylonia areolata TaxID=304850 RepID=UPI003FD24C11
MDHCVKLAVAIWIIRVLGCQSAVVQEKEVSTCNTPCGMLALSCPPRHRLAVREVLFSVTTRSSGPCALTQTCGTQTLCCEQSSVQECVFSYSPSHLEAVHRNCSGMRACAVKTERTEEESVACPFFRPEDTVSHTVLDYVCISEEAIVDTCTVKETQVQGRTLFTMLDTGRWRNPRGGAVCRCTAESVRWPTTNTIAVFVVDMRLNMLREAPCSKADVTLKSGSVTRHLDCESSRDPRQAFPFVALLNHSNVATVDLVLHKKLPEIVWIGFESNEMEDIRLTCALQGYVPIPHDEEESDNVNGTQAKGQTSDNEGRTDTEGMNMVPVAGGVAGALVLCAVLVTLVVLGVVYYRKRQRSSKANEYSDPHDAVDDIDVYYSTPDLSIPHIHSSGAGGGGAGAAGGPTEGGGEEDEAEVYVTAAAVRERKRQSTKKVVRVLSIPDISDDVAEYYASPWDIRDRRRLEEGEKGGLGDSPPPLPPPLPSPTVCSEEDDNDNDYALLEREGRRADSEDQEQNYDRLSELRPPSDKGDNPGRSPAAEVGSEGKGQSPPPHGLGKAVRGDHRPEPDGGNHNPAFLHDHPAA